MGEEYRRPPSPGRRRIFAAREPSEILRRVDVDERRKLGIDRGALRRADLVHAAVRGAGERREQPPRVAAAGRQIGI
ncbi:MAG: hypothetical protein ACK559_30675, partial [bacterium]